MKRHIFIFGLLTLMIFSTVAIFTAETGSTMIREPTIRSGTIAHSTDAQVVGSSEYSYSTAIVSGNITWIGTTIPSGYYYHFNPIQTLYGSGCRIDSIGKSASDMDYHFLAYTNSDYLVGPNGGIQVRGYFRQNDTFPADLQQGRRQRTLYVMYSDNPNVIVVTLYVLYSTDGTSWHYKDLVIGGLTPNATVKVGIGTVVPYAADWSMEVDWAGVEVLYTSASGPFMPGPGYVPGGGGTGTGGGSGAGGGTGGGSGSSGLPSSYVVVLPALAVFLILAAVFIARRRSDEGHGQDEVASSAIEDSQTQPDETAYREQPSPVSTLIPCPECGAQVKPTSAAYCTRCGASLQGNPEQTPAEVAGQKGRAQGETCIVCKLRILVGEEMLRCPYCGNGAHRVHFLEWLHVKDFCPVCGRHLDEEHLRS